MYIVVPLRDPRPYQLVDVEQLLRVTLMHNSPCWVYFAL